MYKITNITRGPIQLVIRSKKGKRLTVLNVPGVGSGKNVYFLEDERYTDYIDRAKRAKFIEVEQEIVNTKQ